MDNKEILKNAFKDVIVANEVDEDVIAHYFDKNYQQWVDDHELDYFGFVAHMYAQKKRVKQASVEFKSMVSENDKVATIHQIRAMTIEGNEVSGKVIAHFTFDNNKITRCEELTFFEKAEEKDRDLGHVS